MGNTDEVKDFLKRGATDTFNQDDKNSTRRRCVVFYLDKMNDDDKWKIKQGNFSYYIIYFVISFPTSKFSKALLCICSNKAKSISQYTRKGIK